MTIFEVVGRFFCWWMINIDMLLLAFLFLGSLFLIFNRKRWGKTFFSISCIGFAFFAIVPIGPWLLENLENRFPTMKEIPPDAKGMIFLAGTFYIKAALARGEPSHNAAVGRFINIAKLAQRYPHLKIVHTGNVWESALARQTLKALGTDYKSIIFEEAATNTIGNASNTAILLKPKLKEKWVLVTSASHMPRSIGLFRKSGFSLIPYPVDYRTTGQHEMLFFLGIQKNMAAWQTASREWLGMISGYLMGKSDELYPKP